MIEQIHKYDSLLDSFQSLQGSYQGACTERDQASSLCEDLRGQAAEAQRKIAYMQEEKRLIMEKQERTQRMHGEQKQQEIGFVVQEYEAQLAAMRGELELKASEALQVRVQFDQVGGQIGRMEEMAERYQEAQRTIGDQQRVIG